MTVDFDMSEVNKLAADLTRSAPAAERASSVALSVVAGKFASGARSTVAVRSGETQASIRVESDGEDAVVIADSDAAFHLEFGTSDTAPQPFMGPQIPTAARALAEALGAVNPLD